MDSASCVCVTLSLIYFVEAALPSLMSVIYIFDLVNEAALPSLMSVIYIFDLVNEAALPSLMNLQEKISFFSATVKSQCVIP